MNARTLEIICMVLGLVLYLIPAANPPSAKLNEIGRLSFAVGLLAFLLSYR